MNWSRMLTEALPVSLDLRGSLKKCCVLLVCLENCRKRRCVPFILPVIQIHLFLENVAVLQRGRFPLLFSSTFLSTQEVTESRI